MLRSLLALAGLGAVGLVAWKLLWVMVLPMLFGFLALILKMALIALVVFVVYRLFRRVMEPRPQPH